MIWKSLESCKIIKYFKVWEIPDIYHVEILKQNQNHGSMRRVKYVYCSNQQNLVHGVKCFAKNHVRVNVIDFQHLMAQKPGNNTNGQLIKLVVSSQSSLRKHTSDGSYFKIFFGEDKSDFIQYKVSPLPWFILPPPAWAQL